MVFFSSDNWVKLGICFDLFATSLTSDYEAVGGCELMNQKVEVGR